MLSQEQQVVLLLDEVWENEFIVVAKGFVVLLKGLMSHPLFLRLFRPIILDKMRLTYQFIEAVLLNLRLEKGIQILLINFMTVNPMINVASEVQKGIILEDVLLQCFVFQADGTILDVVDEYVFASKEESLALFQEFYLFWKNH